MDLVLYTKIFRMIILNTYPILLKMNVSQRLHDMEHGLSDTWHAWNTIII
jgi:hypothetical protein